jgi:hypothetical protein
MERHAVKVGNGLVDGDGRSSARSVNVRPCDRGSGAILPRESFSQY